MRIAVYPGTFDPVTNGHLDLVDRARRHFDRLIVAILRNEDKRPLFTDSERMDLIRGSIGAWDNVSVDSFEGLLVAYARKQKAIPHATKLPNSAQWSSVIRYT